MSRLGTILILIAALFIAACWNVGAVFDWLVISPIFGPHYAIARWLILLAVVVAIMVAAAWKGSRLIDADEADEIRRQIDLQF